MATTPNPCDPPPAAWVDPYTLRTASDGLDEVLNCVNWVLHICEAALQPQPHPAAIDAWLFAGAVMGRLGHLRETPHWIDLHAAVNLGDTSRASAIKNAIDQHNLRNQALALPDYLHEYLVRHTETGIDYTQRPRGGDRWRHAARDRDLARAAYEWRLTQPAYDWRKRRDNLADPKACLHWTANALTDTLDCIGQDVTKWPAEPKAGLEFFPPAALCSAYGLPVGDDQDALLHRIYPDHFRGLLIGHVAALCLDEWERRIAVGLELP